MKKITKNLYLGRFTVNDITSEYVEALNDKEVVRFTEARHKTWDYQKVKEFVEDSNIEGVRELIGIFLKGSDKHIGNIRLHFNNQHRRVELGIMIWDKTQWNKGYATEALKALIKYVFQDLKLHKICADYYSVNIASAEMFKKLGFKIEGVFKNHFLLNGKYLDSIRIAKFNHEK